MTKAGRTYFLVALLLLLVGTVQGFWMGATNALQYKNLHVALLLPGFVTLSVYGALYRLWPELERARLARLQFILATLGVLVLVIGTIVQALSGSIVLDAIGAAIVIAGVALMLYLFATATE